MSKRRYQARDFQATNWDVVQEHLAGEGSVVFAIDVAKEVFLANLQREGRDTSYLVRWRHPEQSRAVVEKLIERFGAESLEVVMEPSGTYGDALRGLFHQAGVAVYRISPKRVHDAAEVYDGVPSLHDAKAATVIGRLHLERVSRRWEEPSGERLELQARLKELEVYQERYQSSVSRLEAQLSRHWPEAQRWVGLDSKSLLRLLARFGDAAAVSAAPEEARKLLRCSGGAALSREKIDGLVASAETTIGVVALEAERGLMRFFAKDLLELREHKRQQERVIEQRVSAAPTVEAMARIVGTTTSAVLVASAGSPVDYPDGASYLKGLGLNLKERSSGKQKGQLKITKRGPGVARHYLYFAVLRLIKASPVVQAWVEQKAQRDGGRKGKAIIAVMRKLTKALWHVSQGECFEVARLFDVRKLGLVP